MTNDTNIWWIIDADAEDAAIRDAVSIIPQRLIDAGLSPNDLRPFHAWQAAADFQPHDEHMAGLWGRIQAEVLKRIEEHCPALTSPYATEAEVVPRDVLQ